MKPSCPDPVHRRTFLRAGALALGGLTLPDLLAARAQNVGQVVGATNAKGEYPKERPLRPRDLLATSYQHLGIDPRQEFKDHNGRPIPVLGDGEPIRELT